MTTTAAPSLMEYFADVPDPRIERCKDHALIDILTIAILATICGAEYFTQMEEFGKTNSKWLRTFLELKNGIPSHDTFARVFAAIKPAAFQERFLNWVHAISELSAGEVIAIDGKAARRSHDKKSGLKPLHLVSAWATRNRLVLGQAKVDQKSNEITAVPELLRLLEIKGCIVTVDALNTQKEIAAQIRAQGADYLMALKNNHPTLAAEVAGIFCAVREEAEAEGSISESEDQQNNHGRKETRRCWSVAAPEWLFEFEDWRDLQSLILIESTRQLKAQATVELRYYLSSLPPEAQVANRAVREHWGIENSLHWVLDVAFREDDSRIRVGNAAANLALVRKIALNLLHQDTSFKGGVKTKRLKAGWDRDYLLKVISLNPTDN